jgi:hypothetical protein
VGIRHYPRRSVTELSRRKRLLYFRVRRGLRCRRRPTDRSQCGCGFEKPIRSLRPILAGLIGPGALALVRGQRCRGSSATGPPSFSHRSSARFSCLVAVSLRDPSDFTDLSSSVSRPMTGPYSTFRRCCPRVGRISIRDAVGDFDAAIDGVDNHETLRPALPALAARERTIRVHGGELPARANSECDFGTEMFAAKPRARRRRRFARHRRVVRREHWT